MVEFIEVEEEKKSYNNFKESQLNFFIKVLICNLCIKINYTVYQYSQCIKFQVLIGTIFEINKQLL